MYDTLKQQINDTIKANGKRQITGTNLNQVLNAIVSELGEEGASLGGFVTPSQEISESEGNIFYIASEAGTYTNFDDIVVGANEIAFLYKANGEWTKASVPTYVKPSNGIPSTDLDSSVQTSLGKADTALQQEDIAEIESVIPAEADKDNKLADKNYVDTNISTASATFRGTSAADLTEQQFIAWANALTKDNNDYVFWNTVDSDGDEIYKRYKWNGTQWSYEFTLSNTDKAILYKEQNLTDQQRNTALANVSNQTANSTTGKMGYVVLQPEKDGDASTSFASQIANKPNTIFEIRNVFDLSQEEVSPTSVLMTEVFLPSNRNDIVYRTSNKITIPSGKAIVLPQDYFLFDITGSNLTMISEKKVTYFANQREVYIGKSRNRRCRYKEDETIKAYLYYKNENNGTLTTDLINVSAGHSITELYGATQLLDSSNVQQSLPFTPVSDTQVKLAKAKEANISVSYSIVTPVVIPANTTLKFNGGMLKNGVIVGNRTKIEAALNKIFDTDVMFDGTFDNSEGYPEWFGGKADNVTDNYDAITALLNATVFPVVQFQDGTYRIGVTEDNNDVVFNVESNRILRGVNKYDHTLLSFVGNSIKYGKYVSDYCISLEEYDTLDSTQKAIVDANNSRMDEIETEAIINHGAATKMDYDLAFNTIFFNCIGTYIRFENLTIGGSPNSLSAYDTNTSKPVDDLRGIGIHCLSYRNGEWYSSSNIVIDSVTFKWLYSATKIEAYSVSVNDSQALRCHDGFVFMSRFSNLTTLICTRCYSNFIKNDGYYIQDASYSSLRTCAADNIEGTAYHLYGCGSVTLLGCGTEGSKQAINFDTCRGCNITSLSALMIYYNSSNIEDNVANYERFLYFKNTALITVTGLCVGGTFFKDDNNVYYKFILVDGLHTYLNPGVIFSGCFLNTTAVALEDSIDVINVTNTLAAPVVFADKPLQYDNTEGKLMFREKVGGDYKWLDAMGNDSDSKTSGSNSDASSTLTKVKTCFAFYNETFKAMQWKDSTGKWINYYGNKPHTTVGDIRPTGMDSLLDKGFMFYDMLLDGGKPIWWNGTAWADAAGQVTYSVTAFTRPSGLNPSYIDGYRAIKNSTFHLKIVQASSNPGVIPSSITKIEVGGTQISTNSSATCYYEYDSTEGIITIHNVIGDIKVTV